MGIENRRYKRVVLKKEVLINGSIKAQGLDLSLGGMYVHTGRAFTVGTVMSITLPLDSGIIHVRARVRNVTQSAGIGVEFIDKTPAQETAIRNFVSSAGLPSPGEGRKTVLVVDDNAAARRMNRSRLMLDGYAVLEAENGMQAIDILEKEKVDLVVLDLYMEKLDGYKVLSMMRMKPEWRDLPVLVLSARSSPDEVDRAVAAGATEYLVKMTTSPVKLSQRIKMYLPENRSVHERSKGVSSLSPL